LVAISSDGIQTNVIIYLMNRRHRPRRAYRPKLDRLPSLHTSSFTANLKPNAAVAFNTKGSDTY